jgi:16S rRNA processing protein RimM
MSQLAPNNEVIIGQLGRPHGVKGLLKMQVFGGEAVNLIHTRPWLMKNSEGSWQPILPEKVEAKPGYMLVKLDGINDRDAAQALTNKEIAIYASQLPKLETGEYYWNELIGLDVINQAGINLGVVTDLMETGSNDVLILDDKGIERLIPYLLDEYVLRVDIKAKQIIVDWDENF